MKNIALQKSVESVMSLLRKTTLTILLLSYWSGNMLIDGREVLFVD